MSKNGATYTNKNVNRKFTHQLHKDFDWKMTDIMEEYNLSPEAFLEEIHRYIRISLIRAIKEKGVKSKRKT